MMQNGVIGNEVLPNQLSEIERTSERYGFSTLIWTKAYLGISVNHRELVCSFQLGHTHPQTVFSPYVVVKLVADIITA